MVFFHAGLSAFSGGFVGVDVFFVISGYVIALSLLEDIRHDRFSILAFYERRVRRIFPALVFTFAATWIVAWFLLLPEHFLDFSRSLQASAAFVSNHYFWKNSGYFDNSALLRPLLHTWSLSVEEQFYIFMPIAMFVVARYLRRRWALAFVPVIVASLGLSIYATTNAPTANFFLLPTRAWELLLGVLLALRPPPAVKGIVAELLAILGLGLIAFAVLVYTKATPFPGLTALAPCLGAALIIYVGTSERTSVTRLLSWQPLVWIGLISYSLYLVHWPIVVFTRYVTLLEPTVLHVLAIIVASIALAAFSWRFIEQPFRHPKARVSRPRLLTGGVTAMALAAGVGFGGAMAARAPWRFPDLPMALGATADLWISGTCFLADNPDYRQWDAKKCTRTTGAPVNALLWGDSFAAHYVPGILANAGMMSANVMQYTSAGCPPVIDYYSHARSRCQEFNRHAFEIIRQHDIKIVILAARWTDLESRGLDMIQSTIDALAQAKVDIWLIGQSTEFAAAAWVIDYKKGHGPNGVDAWPLAIDRGINERLRKVVGGKVHFIDPLDYLCRQEGCAYRQQGRLLYADYGHFSELGSSLAVKAYFPLYQGEREVGSAPTPQVARP